MHYSKNKLLLFLFFSLLVWMACQGNSSQNSSQNSGKKAVEGAQIYKQYCISCHGADGQLGLNGAAKLTKTTLTRQEVIQVIKKGRNMMSPYENILTQKQVGSVADYILTFSR